jgi:hypothetical protein
MFYIFYGLKTNLTIQLFDLPASAANLRYQENDKPYHCYNHEYAYAYSGFKYIAN